MEGKSLQQLRVTDMLQTGLCRAVPHALLVPGSRPQLPLGAETEQLQGTCDVAPRVVHRTPLLGSSFSALPLQPLSPCSACLQCSTATAPTLHECEHRDSLPSRLGLGDQQSTPSLTKWVKLCAHVQGQRRRSCPWPQELPGCLRGLPALLTSLVGTHREQKPPGMLPRQGLGPARGLLRLPRQGPEAVKGLRCLDAPA